MAQFQRHFVQELTKPLIVRQCGDLGFTGDNLSDVISVDLYTDGEAYSGGGTCAGACICPDGSTVALTGAVSGKTASVTLTEDCFAIPGQIGIGIRVTTGTTKTTVLKAIYNVEPFSTNNPVDPGSRIALDVGDLINRIDAAVESIPASADQLKAAMAPNFSDTTPYPSGAYVWNNGTLYRFTTAHAAGSWTGTDATAVALGNDVADLKSATSEHAGITLLQFTQNAFIDTKGQKGDYEVPITSPDWKYCVVTCVPGDTFTINGTSGTTPRLWAFIDDNDDKKILSAAEPDAIGDNTVIIAPNNATRLIVNNRTTDNTVSYKGLPEKNKFIGVFSDFTSGYYDFAGKAVGDDAPISTMPSKDVVSANVLCDHNTVFIVTGVGGDTARLYAFVDSDGKIIELTDQYTTVNKKIIIPPVNTARAIFNFRVFQPYTLINLGSYLKRTNIGTSTVIKIAASDSSADDKADAFVVCTGNNDADVINNCIAKMVSNGGGKIILKKGRYLINKLSDSGNRHCIDIDVGSTVVEIESEIANYNRNASAGQEAYTGAQLYMTNELYETLRSDVQYKFISCSSNGFDGGIVLKNFGVVIPHNQKQIVGLDFIDFNGMCRCEGLYLNAYNKDHEPNVSVATPPAKAAYNCIGLRTICKTTLGAIGTQYKNIIVKGFWEGIAVNGEHTFMDRCAAVFCVLGWTFDHYNIVSESARQHENLLLRCMDERNVSLPHFYSNPNKQATIIIGLNIERKVGNTPGGELGRFAVEDEPGTHFGEITYTIATGKTTQNDVDTPFWEDGHGHGFRSTNLIHLQSCDSATRQSYKANYMQRIYDTTLNKEVICIDESVPTWVDTNGNVVT